MNCFSGMTYSMYLDRELGEEERRHVEAHLRECSPCRAQVAALEAEDRLLREAFRLAEEEAGAAGSPAHIGRSLLWTAVSALAGAIGLNWAAGGLERLVPSAVSWTNVFSLTWLQSLFFSEAFDLVQEGPAVLNALLTFLGFLVLGALAAGVLRYLLRRHPMSAALVAMTMLALSLPRPVSAIDARHAGTVRVAANETVDDSLAAAGDTVEVAGTVNGNLFAVAHRVVVRGDVKGDVFVAARIVEIPGTVEGNLFGCGTTLTVSGRIVHSAYLAARSFQLDPAGHVADDVWTAGDEVRLFGAVGRDVMTAGSSAEAGGVIGRDLDTYSGHDGLVVVNSSARIGGNLEAHVEKKEQVQIDQGASVAGKTEIVLSKPKPSSYTQGRFYRWQGIELAGAFAAGLLLYWLFPTLFGAKLDAAGTFGRTAGIGLLILIVTPIVAAIACITLVGLPLGLITLLVWLIGLYLAKIFVGALLGRGLLERRSGGPSQPFALALVVGLLVIFVATNLPYYIGAVISSLVILVGLGLAFRGVREARRGAARV